MSAKVIDIDKGWKKIQEEVTKMKNSHTKVGYFSDGGTNPSENVAALALLHEKGASIKVTPKMKGYFLFKFGIALKKAYIIIPSRPWNRVTFEKYQHAIKDLLIYEYNKILEGKQNAKNALSKIGEWYVGRLKDTMTKGSFAPNSGFTTAQKGSSKPLIDEGTMRNSTTHKEFMK